jgi:lysophospholipase L1-like esterase
MTTLAANASVTLALDYDDVLTTDGGGTFVMTPASGSAGQGYLTGHQILGPYKQDVTVVLTAGSNPISYSLSNDYTVDRKSEGVAASRTAVLADASNVLICNSSSPIVLTIQNDATTGWSARESIDLYQQGTGAASFAAGAGVTIRGSAPAAAQYSTQRLRRMAANEWAYVSSSATGASTNVGKAAIRQIRPIIGFAGDSIAVLHGNQTFDSAILWLLSRYYNADLYWDQRSYANGGYNYGVGGATTRQIIGLDSGTDQRVLIAARTPDILFVNGGTNDGMSAYAGAQASAANQQALITAALAAGVQLVLLYPLLPRSGQTGGAIQAFGEFNRMMRNFADATPGVYFVDVLQYFLDPTSASYAPIGGSGGGAGAVTNEGLHPSVAGAAGSCGAFQEALSQVCRIRRPRALAQNEVWNSANAPHSNVLGSKGLMLATTGGTLNAVTNAGVADGWAVTTSAGVTATPSIVASSYIPGGYNMQKFVLSGTPSVDGSLVMQCVLFSPSYFASTTKWAIEMVVRMNTTVNIGPPSMNALAVGSGAHGNAPFGGNTTIHPCSAAPSGDYHLFVYEGAPIITDSGASQWQPAISLGVFNGLAVSGSVEIGFVGIFPLN